MVRRTALSLASCALLASGAFGCSSVARPTTTSSPSGSEIAVSVVSGALNTNSGSGVALAPPAPTSSAVGRVLAFLNPEGTAYAASWSCTGDTLMPSFDGPAAAPYSFTPASCSVVWADGESATSTWSGPFTLTYGASCDSTHAFMEKQVAGCELTRTTGTSGATRTITGPEGNSVAIEHNTNGAGTGWDPRVTPAPSDGGVQLTCGAGGCAASRTLVINGSHLTGTTDIRGVRSVVWDHTVSTGPGGLTVQGSGTGRVVSGTVTVQHNLLRYTSTTTFASVSYGEPLCCFPTAGSVTTTFSSGGNAGKTEAIAFSPVCGEATLTRPDGVSEPLTFQHCL